MFGFGDYTGIDIYEESKANMPTREWKMARHRVPWYQGDTIPVGIGQGYWTATPMQIAKATSVLVNEGEVTAPHLLRSTIENGRPFDEQVLSNRDLSTSNWCKAEVLGYCPRRHETGKPRQKARQDAHSRRCLTSLPVNPVPHRYSA